MVIFLSQQNKKANNHGLGERKTLISFLNSYSEGLSGSDLRFIEVAKRLQGKKTKLVIVTSQLGKELCEKKNLKATFNVTSKEAKLGNIVVIYTQRIITALFMRLKLKKGDVLYSSSDFLPDALPSYFLRLKNKNVRWVQTIHHIQGDPFIRVGRSRGVNLLGFISQKISLTLIKKRADLIIVMNPLIKKQLLQLGFDEKRIRINYNGVNLKAINAFEPSAKKFDGVFLGRLNTSKGIFDLLKVWSNVLSWNPNAKLAIIGKGDRATEKKLRLFASELNIESNVDFCGYLSDSEAFGILKSAKVFIFPSYEEGFGIAVLEAIACGLPVVAYNLPVYREIFGDQLVSVPLGSIDSISQRVRSLLENPELARKIGDAGICVAKEYDWDAIANREQSLIENI